MILNFIRTTLLRWSIPLTRWIGKVHAPFSKKRITSKDYYKIKELIRPGDVLLVRTRGEFTNLFIPSHYTHGAIISINDEVIEALGEGVILKDLIDFLFSKDEVILLRAKFAAPSEALEACWFAERKIGKPYDYLFKPNNDSFYCFELIYAAYQHALKNNSSWKLRETLGTPTVIGDDFTNAKEKWEIIYNSKEGK